MDINLVCVTYVEAQDHAGALREFQGALKEIETNPESLAQGWKVRGRHACSLDSTLFAHRAPRRDKRVISKIRTAPNGNRATSSTP